MEAAGDLASSSARLLSSLFPPLIVLVVSHEVVRSSSWFFAFPDGSTDFFLLLKLSLQEISVPDLPNVQMEGVC
jgi:hypothetical protein